MLFLFSHFNACPVRPHWSPDLPWWLCHSYRVSFSWGGGRLLLGYMKMNSAACRQGAGSGADLGDGIAFPCDSGRAGLCLEDEAGAPRSSKTACHAHVSWVLEFGVSPGCRSSGSWVPSSLPTCPRSGDEEHPEGAPKSRAPIPGCCVQRPGGGVGNPGETVEHSTYHYFTYHPSKIFLFFFFSFFYYSLAYGVPGLQVKQHQIINLLCQVGDQTWVPGLQRQCRFCCVTARTPNFLNKYLSSLGSEYRLIILSAPSLTISSYIATYRHSSHHL